VDVWWFGTRKQPSAARAGAQPADIKTGFNDAVVKGQSSDPRVNKTWQTTDQNMKAAPPPELVARHTGAAVFLDEVLVREQALERNAHLFPAIRPGIAREDGTAIRDELIEVVRHGSPPGADGFALALLRLTRFLRRTGSHFAGKRHGGACKVTLIRAWRGRTTMLWPLALAIPCATG